MNGPSDENVSEDRTHYSRENQEVHNLSHTKQPRYLLLAWILLLLLGALFVFAPFSDLVADARVGLPSDHLEAFHTITGVTWKSAKLLSPKITQYVTLLEVTYAVHELVFGLLFLILVAIPFPTSCATRFSHALRRVEPILTASQRPTGVKAAHAS